MIDDLEFEDVRVASCRVGTLAELLDVANLLRRSGWIFRGQENSEWDLSTSLERKSRAGEPIDFNCEWSAIKKFIELTKGALDFDLSYIDYLCAMQHYGVPTRLLDFTRVFFVALYMAFESKVAKDGSGTRAVWAVDLYHIIENSSVLNNRVEMEAEEETKDVTFPPWAYDITFEGMKSNLSVDDKERVRLCRRCANVLITTGNAAAGEGILPIDLPHNNKRLIAQDGLFLMAQTFAPFEKNLAAALGTDDIRKTMRAVTVDELKRYIRQGRTCLIKVEIDNSLCEEVKNLLLSANYTPNRIYPDVPGIVKFIKYIPGGVDE